MGAGDAVGVWPVNGSPAEVVTAVPDQPSGNSTASFNAGSGDVRPVMPAQVVVPLAMSAPVMAVLAGRRSVRRG
jgi:hypothetical protein